MQLKVTAQDLLAYAKKLKGSKLRTLDRRSPFSVEVNGDGLEYVLKTGRRLRHQAGYLKRMCDQFSDTHSFSTEAYKEKKADQKKTICASYTLPLIVKYLAFLVDGDTARKLAHPKPKGLPR